MDFTGDAIWYLGLPTESGCPPPFAEAELRDAVLRDSERSNRLDDEEKIMGKGNNSQKNDKKDKKDKKDSKKVEVKK